MAKKFKPMSDKKAANKLAKILRKERKTAKFPEPKNEKPQNNS